MPPHTNWANAYDRVYELSFGQQLERLTVATLNQVEKRYAPPARVVDFGAGSGRVALPLAYKGYTVAAVDPCREMLDEIPEHRNIEKVASRMQDFQTDSPFDLALCVYTVISYVLEKDSLRKSFDAVHQALKVGGLFLLDVPSRGLFNNFYVKNQQLDRRVTIKLDEGDTYQYSEKTTLFDEEEPFSYEDAFKIRYWEADYLIGTLSTNFSLKEDLTSAFVGSGGKYLLFEKTR
jgi:SAM-dependent methyltransferase